MEIYRSQKCSAFTYSKTGQNHVLANQDNQDCILFNSFPEDAWVLIVADGVSSATFAKEGAQIAVKTVMTKCKDIIDLGENPLDIDTLRVSIVREWKANIQGNWDEFATTLNFAVYSNHKLILGQIGDGLIMACIDGTPIILTGEDDFYSTDTYALGTAVKKNTFTINEYEVKNTIRLYAVSDGIGKEIADEYRSDLGHYLAQMMVQDDLSIEEELDAWVVSLEKKNGDDKSIGFVLWEE